MARPIAVLFVLLLLLTPATMAEPSQQHALADYDWIGALWHRLMAWISGIGACIQADPPGIGANLIPSGLQCDPAGDPAGIGACIIPEG